MSELDPKQLWRNQPEEEPMLRLVERRTRDLWSSTRSEIIASIAAALVLAPIIAWISAPSTNRFQIVALVVLAAWILATIVRFRRRIWGPLPGQVAGTAAACLDFYRQELQRRRDHLRDIWLWHGPLALAVLMFAVTIASRGMFDPSRLVKILPFVLALIVWVAVGIRNRHVERKALEDELRDLET